MAMRWQGYAIAAVLAAAAAVYALMLFVTVPHLAALATANGAADPRLFDMRPAGYDFAAARDLLAALGETGRAEYLAVQQRLDTAFPPLNGLSLAIGLNFIARRLGARPAVAVFLAAILGLAAAGFDLAENHAVAALLRAGPSGITEVMVLRASQFSAAKSVAVSIAMSLLAAGLVIWLFRRYRNVPLGTRK